MRHRQHVVGSIVGNVGLRQLVDYQREMLQKPVEKAVCREATLQITETLWHYVYNVRVAERACVESKYYLYDIVNTVATRRGTARDVTENNCAVVVVDRYDLQSKGANPFETHKKMG